MRVPSYNEQMRYNTRQKGGRINGLQYSGQAAYEHSANIGKAISGLGNTLARVSDEVYATNMKINEADATKALTQYQKEFLAKQTEIQKLKGEQALNASAEFETWQQQRKQELTKDLSPVAMGMFEQKAGVTFESNRQWVSNYQAREEEVYMDSTYQAQMDMLGDTYLQNIDNPKLMSESTQQAFSEIQQFCQRKGLGQDVAKNMYKDFMSKNAMKGINLHVDNGDLGKARTLLKHSEIYLSADEQAKMKNIIKREQEILNRKASEQREAQFKNQIASIVGENFDRFGEDFTTQQFYQHVETIKDPAQRDKAIMAFEAELGYKKKVAAANYNAELDKLNDDDFRNLPPNERYEKAMKNVQPNWTDEQRNTYMKTASGVYGSSTDPSFYAETLQNIQDGNYESLDKFKDFISNNMHLLTKEDASYLTGQMKGIEDEQNKLYNNAYKTNEKILLPNKKKKEEELDAEEREENMIASFAFSMAVRDKENMLGRKMNADEINAFSIEYAKGTTKVFNRKLGVSFDKKSRFNQDEYEKKYGNFITKFGRLPAEIDRDRKFLESKGIEPTPDNLERLWNTTKVYDELEYMKIDDNIRNKHYDNKKTNNYALNGTLFERGNIDPTTSPIVVDKDGNMKAGKNITIEKNGVFYVIPTILRGKDGVAYEASPEEAELEYLMTGKHFGAFTTKVNADGYAKTFNQEQEKFYAKR